MTQAPTGCVTPWQRWRVRGRLSCSDCAGVSSLPSSAWYLTFNVWKKKQKLVRMSLDPDQLRCFCLDVFLQVCFICFFLDSQTLKIGDYLYPQWAYYAGWAMALSSPILIPIWAVTKICLTEGSIRQVSFCSNMSPNMLPFLLFLICFEYLRKTTALCWHILITAMFLH